MINDYETEYNLSKEVIDALPKNNIKNRQKCIEEIDNLLKKYLSNRDELLDEIRLRHTEYSNFALNPELENINTQIMETAKLFPLLSVVTSSYEKSNLDRYFYDLDHFYNTDLNEVNKNIFACIKKFKEVGIQLSEKDFTYSIYTQNYMKEMLTEEESQVDNLKLKALFENLYWKCPDIIKQITLNLKYLFYKNKKIFEKYYQMKKQELIKEQTEEEIYNYFISLKNKQLEEIKQDKYLIMSKFLNRILDFKDYTEEAIQKNYQLILKENITVDQRVKENVLKLQDSLKEYKAYLNYKYIVDDIKRIYKEKDKYLKIAAPKKKEIDKLESKLISSSKKLNKLILKGKFEKTEDLTNKVNIMISTVESLYREYEENVFFEKIATQPETTSIYEAIEIAVSNYRYIVKLIETHDDTLTYESIKEKIKEIEEFLYSSDLSILKNIYITDERDIAMVIFDKYNLLQFNIKPEALDESNIDTIINNVNTLVNSIYFDKVNINIDNFKFVFNSLDLMDKNE